MTRQRKRAKAIFIISSALILLAALPLPTFFLPVVLFL